MRPSHGTPAVLMELQKRCSKCKRDWPVSQYYADCDKSDGLQVSCKWCKRQQMRRLRAARDSGFSPSVPASRTCNVCLATKPAAEFYTSRTNMAGLSYRCKACDKDYAARRRNRIRANASSLVIPHSKECRMCLQTKAAGEFSRDTGSPDGLNTYCRPCCGIQYVSSKYGISKEEAVRLRHVPNCQICGRKFGKLKSNVDHCHSTGVVRGMLCTRCNAMLGLAKDSQDTLLSACQYLENAKSAGAL